VEKRGMSGVCLFPDMDMGGDGGGWAKKVGERLNRGAHFYAHIKVCQKNENGGVGEPHLGVVGGKTSRQTQRTKRSKGRQRTRCGSTSLGGKKGRRTALTAGEVQYIHDQHSAWKKAGEKCENGKKEKKNHRGKRGNEKRQVRQTGTGERCTCTTKKNSDKKKKVCG